MFLLGFFGLIGIGYILYTGYELLFKYNLSPRMRMIVAVSTLLTSSVLGYIVFKIFNTPPTLP
jgi:hypothetical protein